VFTSDSEERKLYQEYKLADHCKENFVVPVHEDVLQGSGQLVLPMAYGGVLKRGFELEWNQSTAQPSCHLCEQSGGRCSYSDNREFLGCLCSGGMVGAHDCHGSSANTAYADPSSSKFLRTYRSILIPSENKRYLYHARPVKYQSVPYCSTFCQAKTVCQNVQHYGTEGVLNLGVLEDSRLRSYTVTAMSSNQIFSIRTKFCRLYI
jgi:hypothetical protein